MATVPRVRLIATGGTIATTVDSATQLSAPSLSYAELAKFAAELDIEIEGESLGAQPSWALGPRDMAQVALRARDAAREPGIAGVVVSHGTTTLEYTAFLADAVLDVDTPVVLTGSMRKSDDAHPDGPRNLRDAVRVASSAASRARGALVVFHGRIIAASRAWKARRFDEDAFVDTAGDMGVVDEEHVTISGSAARYGPFNGVLHPGVAFVKVVPGMTASWLRQLPKETAGVVVEALPGAGGIPPAMRAELVDLATRLPVVIASRAPYGRLPDNPTGGTGEPFRDSSFLSCGPLTSEQAWLLLMLVLGENPEPSAARARYATELRGRPTSKGRNGG